MELLVSVAGFKHDVDHMPGARVNNKETTHTTYKVWKKHADDMNSKEHNDDAEIVSDSQSEKYMIGNSFFALWSKRTNTGKVWSWK